MKRKNNQGFSLVELLIAIAILSLIMVALASFMGSTTNSYVRSRNDREIQQAGQEVFDMIADKLMQAKLVRIGTATTEYTAVGTGHSVEAGADFALLDSNGAPITTSYGGRARYSFDALTDGTISDSNPIQYIAIIYERVNYAGNFCPARDVYCFYNDSIYLFSYSTNPRPSSYNDGNNSDPDKTLEELESTLDSTIASALAVTIASGPTSTSQEMNLVCNTIKYDGTAPAVSIYALPADNALYLQMDFEKQGMENHTEGMITIRNSYVLQPKAPPSVGSGSSDSGTPTP